MMLEERARRAARGIRHGVELMPVRAGAAVPGTYEGFVRFVERRRRNERIAAIVVSLILVVAAFGAALGLLRSTLRQRPADTDITPQEVSDLELEWSVPSGDPDSEFSPAVAGDLVLAATRHGELFAYPVDCGDPCTPTWQATTGRALSRIAVADGVAYVAEMATGEPGARVYAFEVGCGSGGAACEPLWTGDIGAGVKLNVLPLVAGGKVIVAASDGVVAFDVGCRAGGESCDPVWTAHPRGASAEAGSALLASIVTEDTVYVATHDVVAAYPVDCSGECSSLWRQPAPQMAQWLALWDDTLVVGSYVRYRASGPAGPNHAWGLPVDCPDPRGCGVSWSIETRGITPVSVAGDVLYVIDSMRDLVAYERPCDENGCQVRWRAPSPVGGVDVAEITAEPALVVDGLVYISSANGYLFAYPVDCDRECEPIWEEVGAGWGYTYVAVGAGKVFVGSDGIYAYGLPGEDETQASSGWPGSSWPIIPLVIAVLAAAWLLARRWRKRSVGSTT